MRLAGTWKQYSKNAIAQLAAIRRGSGALRYFKCPYQAKVMKILEIVSRTMVVIGEQFRSGAQTFKAEKTQRTSIMARSKPAT
jgi:hypothetical protein